MVVVEIEEKDLMKDTYKAYLAGLGGWGERKNNGKLSASRDE